MGTHIVRGQQGDLFHQLGRIFLKAIGMALDVKRKDQGSVLRDLGQIVLDMELPPVRAVGSRQHTKRKIG